MRKGISSTLRTQVTSPAVYPILGHALRECLRRLSTVPVLNQPDFARPRGFPSLLREWENEVFPQGMLTPSFFPSLDTLASWDFMDDLRKKRLYPGYAIHEDEAHHKVHVTMDLPGVKMEDINVELEDDELLRISGHRKKTDEDGSVSEMKFDRRLRLGKVVDLDHIVASLADGVLNVTIPKLPEESKDHVRKIEVIQGSGEIEC